MNQYSKNFCALQAINEERSQPPNFRIRILKEGVTAMPKFSLQKKEKQSLTELKNRILYMNNNSIKMQRFCSYLDQKFVAESSDDCGEMPHCSMSGRCELCMINTQTLSLP